MKMSTTYDVLTHMLENLGQYIIRKTRCEYCDKVIDVDELELIINRFIVDDNKKQLGITKEPFRMRIS